MQTLSEWILTAGNEFKLVYPQPEAEPNLFEGLKFDHFYLQPMDGGRTAENTRLALQYCLEHPKWSLSLQIHKILEIP